MTGIESTSRNLLRANKDDLSSFQTILVEVPTSFITYCAFYGTTPAAVFAAFVRDTEEMDQANYDPYGALFHQAARNYVKVAFGDVKIMSSSGYIERPE